MVTELEQAYTIDDIIRHVINNPKKDIIEEMRCLNRDSNEYKAMKKKLPYVSPSGFFSKIRKNENLIEPSGILYYDVDSDDQRGEELKEYVIDKYAHLLYMCGLSVSGKGLFIYIKVNGLTKENFSAVYEHVKTKILKDIKTDNNAKGISRAHVIPYDPHVYVNHNCSIDVEDLDIVYTPSTYIGTLSIRNEEKIGYTPDVPFLSKDIIWPYIKHETYEYRGDMVFDIEPVDNLKLYIPKFIPDGKKHKIFRGIVNGLVMNNPDITLFHVLSVINYVNERCTGNRPMDMREMIRTVEAEYKRILQTGEIKSKTSLKLVHLNKNLKLPKDEKIRIANQVNGLIKKYESVKRIEEARADILSKGKKVTKRFVAAVSKLSSKTVKRNWDMTTQQIAEQIIELKKQIHQK